MKSRVSEIRVKRIRVNQGVGVYLNQILGETGNKVCLQIFIDFCSVFNSFQIWWISIASITILVTD